MKYLFTAVAVLGLSSCVSTVNQYFARRALVADEAVKIHTPISEVLKVGDSYYVRGQLCRARGVQRGVPINSVLYQYPNYTFEAIEESGQEVFVELRIDPPYTLKQAAAKAEFTAGAPLHRLPEQAQLINLPREEKKTGSTIVTHGTARTDAHRYYAYPLAAITAVAIDAPASVVMTAMLLPTIGVGALVQSLAEQFDSDEP